MVRDSVLTSDASFTLLSDVAFGNHTENRWVMANAILEEDEPVRALLVQMVDRIDRELGSSDASR